jgi:hypothetical protein
MLVDYFPSAAALDPTSSPSILKTDATAQVYSITDTAFATPLALEDLSGVPMGTTLTSSSLGFYPAFRAPGYTQVIAVSGTHETPLISLYGLILSVVPDPSEAEDGDFLGISNGAYAIVAPPDGTIPSTVGVPLSWVLTPAGWAQQATSTSGISGAPDTWPTSFPAAPHTHPATQIADATSVGRAVMTAQDAQTARAAIGAGTPVTPFPGFGNTSTTAARGDHVHAATEVTFAPTTAIPDTNVQAAIERAATMGGGGSGAAGLLVVKYASGAYPALPATKPSGVQLVIFKGPVQPTSGNVASGIPSWVGDGATQIMADYEYRNLA